LNSNRNHFYLHPARTLNVEIAGATANVEKTMATEGIRRIGQLAVKIRVPGEFTEEQKTKLERAAHTCPVHKSLHPDVQIPIEFVWD
ncbi:OsmC family protein, partial [Silvibacterium sp.]|uniref:OsmC family protein n=1 Tax=Silvibacterium sp. TaxID=1964179 RepID=UPI0039E37346